MDCYNLKQLLVLTIVSIFCWNISTAMYVNPHLQLPPHDHVKGGAPTTVCVQIKPNGVDTHNPYYMCNRPQFQGRQLNMPIAVAANEDNYPNYSSQHSINKPSLVNAYQQQQQALNNQNYAYYRPQQAQLPPGINTIGGNHQAYQQKNLQNSYGQQKVHLQVPSAAGVNAQNYPYYALQQPYGGYPLNHNIQTLSSTNNGAQLNNEQHLNARSPEHTYSDRSQQFPDTGNLMKANEEHFMNFQPHKQQQTTARNNENHPQQPFNNAGVIKVTEINKLNYTQQKQATQPQYGHNLQSVQQMSSTTPSPFKHFFNHNNEHLLQAVTEPTHIEALQQKSTESTGTSFKEVLLNPPNTKQQEEMKEKLKPPLTRSQYQALIQDEVLATPNLEFSSEEMLPIQQLFRDNMPQSIYNARITPEQLNDPILRTFYNIKQTPEVYKQALGQQNCNACHYNNAPSSGMQSYLAQLHKPAYNNAMQYPANPYMEANCAGCRRYTMQPILLAIPLFGSQVEKSYPYGQQAVAQSCGYSSGHVRHAKEDEPEQVKANKNEQPRLNENSSEESKTTLPITTTPSLPLSTTQTSEEDLFKEDSIENIQEPKKGNVKKNLESLADDDKSKKAVDNVKSTTTSQPPTTAAYTTFRTIMHAAKMMAKLPLFHHNKRQAQYEDGDIPTNFKKEYLKKLEKDNSEE